MNPYERTIMTVTQTPAVDVRVGDELALDSGNYIVRVEFIALVRGTQIEIKYRQGRSLTTHSMIVNKYAKIPVIK